VHFVALSKPDCDCDIALSNYQQYSKILFRNVTFRAADSVVFARIDIAMRFARYSFNVGVQETLNRLLPVESVNFASLSSS